MKDADPEVIEQLKDPARQKRIQESKSAQQYKTALEVASKNLKKLADAGVTIAFGTDTGPPARFQGYFEHLELELMVKAGLSPMQAIVSATGDAAKCLNLSRVGTLAQGKWADMIKVEALGGIVRDEEVNEALIQTLVKNEVCLCPTLTREVSTFVYERLD